MNKRILVWLSLVSLCAAFALPGFSPGQTVLAATSGAKPDVSMATHHDVSPPLRDIQPTKSAAPGTQVEVPLGYLPPVGGSEASKPDSTLQSPKKGPKVGVTTGPNFDGVMACAADVFCHAPPDTNGAVGATQYVQWVNTAFAVYDKTSGALQYGPALGNTLWTGFGGGCEANNNGDPIALYDHLANRWFLSQFSVTNPTTYHYLQCVAVSTTSDATGTYNRYVFDYGPTAFNDYGKAGIWPDGYYMTYNIFNGKPDAPQSTFGGSKACSFDRAKMIAGLAASQVCFDLGTSYGGVLPSDLDGATPPPAGSPNFLMNFGANSLNLWKFHVDFATPANSTLTGPTNIPVAAFTPACNGFFRSQCIPQPGTTQTLESLGDRLMYRLAYRNFGDHESLVVNHSILAGSSISGVRWYELRDPNGTPTVYQQATLGGDGAVRFMGSIAMDHSGNMALGYSIVDGSTIHPSINYTGRLASDPLNTMQAENNIIVGSGSQLSGLARWGDYSAMSVDPADDCTFWYTQEYWKANGSFSWSTRIASFKFPSCPNPPIPTGLHVTGATYNSVSYAWSEANATAAIEAYDGAFHTLTPGTTTWTTYGIAYGSYGCLTVAAFSADGASAYTPYACSQVVPITPYNPHLTGATTSAVNFGWNNYDSLSYLAAFDGTVNHPLGQNATTYSAPTAAGYFACITVAAYNGSFTSPYSPYACGLAMPAQPSAVHTTGHTATSVSFAWTNHDPYSGIALTNDGVHLLNEGINATTYTQSGLSAGQYSCISLAAYNSAGATAYTTYVCGQAG